MVNAIPSGEPALRRAVARAGSQTALARLLGVTQQAVSQWLVQGRPPASHVLPIERATGVSRHELRPDLYPRGVTGETLWARLTPDEQAAIGAAALELVIISYNHVNAPTTAAARAWQGMEPTAVGAVCEAVLSSFDRLGLLRREGEIFEFLREGPGS